MFKTIFSHTKRAVRACALALFMSTLAVTTLSTGLTSYAMVGDFVDGQYVYNNGSAIEGALEKGISISKYQNRAGSIDWNAVKNAGVSFAMVRVGYLRDLDPYFDENMRNAAAAGLKVGAYVYSQATDNFSAAQEAYFMIETLKDYPVSYPVALDMESDTILQANLSKEQLAELVNTFCKIVADAGYTPILYGNSYWFSQHLDSSLIPYDIWYARYGTDQHDYPNRTIWQCTDSGKVDGIVGNVTLELAFKDYSTVIPSDTWRSINGKWYYFKNYVKQTGWLDLDGKRYYLGTDGAMVAGTSAMIDGNNYNFDASGALIQ